MTLQTLNVALGARAYDIHIGPGLLTRADLVTPVLASRRVVLVSNETVAPLYLNAVQRAWQAAGLQVDAVVLPDGEAHKNWETLNRIFDALMQMRADRSTTIAALGGGVIGDLAGFAAACYQRGVSFIQLPTTLLAQVDSSVGGKTGINHPRGKNMIGAFWQPRLVLADTDALASLPAREYSAGLAEVIKYGLIRDAEFLLWLEAHIAALMARDAAALTHAIARSCANKAAVVAADELETAPENGRALLNLGHTFGHAIEAGAGYGAWLHGEAVAIGMVMAAELSQRLGWLGATEVARVRALLTRADLRVCGPRLGAATYLDLMGHDKKVSNGRLRLVLLKQLGEAVTCAEVAPEKISAAIEACCVG